MQIPIYDLSVVLLTYKNFTLKCGCIEHVLLALIHQTGVRLQLIVVDNGSDLDEHKTLKASLKKHAPGSTLLHCNASIAAGRNAGASFALSDLIIFIDDDCILLQSDALQQVCNFAQVSSHGYGAIRYWTPEGGWFAENASRLLSELAQGHTPTLQNNLCEPCATLREKLSTKYLMRSFIGHFGFVRKKLFKKTGGFPQQFFGYGLEDDAFSFLCYFLEPTFQSLQAIQVIHVSHELLGSQFKQLALNQKTYSEFLQTRGVKNFHIGRLLYPQPNPGEIISQNT